MRSSLKKIERIKDILDLNGDVLTYIPFAETKKYVDKVKTNYNVYKHFYQWQDIGDKWQVFKETICIVSKK